MKPLTDKQRRFIDEYCIDQNATEAYKRAGYQAGSDNAAAVAASRLLANPRIRAEVDARLAELAKKARITAEEAWRELGHIARSDIGDILDMTGVEPRLKPANQIPESARRAIKSVKVKRYMEGSGDDAREVELIEFTFWDKPGQIGVALRALGELKEKVEHSGPGGKPIESTVTVIDSRAKILSFAEEFREAALQNLAEAALRNETTDGQGTEQASAEDNTADGPGNGDGPPG